VREGQGGHGDRREAEVLLALQEVLGHQGDRDFLAGLATQEHLAKPADRDELIRRTTLERFVLLCSETGCLS